MVITGDMNTKIGIKEESGRLVRRFQRGQKKLKTWNANKIRRES